MYGKGRHVLNKKKTVAGSPSGSISISSSFFQKSQNQRTHRKEEANQKENM